MEEKRLTIKDERGFYRFNCPKEKQEDCELLKCCAECYSEKVVERLGELEDKIEQGTLIEFNMKMPFKVGDTAYWLNGLPNCIQEYKVLGYIFDYSSGVRVDLGDFQPILFRCFGINLFATHKEAEKRLKELQG